MKVDELEELGIVEKVPEEFLDQVVESPIFAVYKNNVFDRLVNHFKKLNDATVELEYKIPVVDEVINSLRGCKYFSIGDVVKGYFHVKMDLESRKYTAFRTRKGIYWYLRMAMGLNGAPARFAEFIEENFSDIVKNYFDDLISGDVTLEENVVRVIRMFWIRCRERQIYLSRKKLKLFRLEIEILGRTIRENIINSSNQTLRVFKTDFEINDEAKREFDLLRKELKNTVDLMLPDPTKEYFVYTDASDIDQAILTKDQLKALELLSQFNYDINHIEGKNNVGADVLSRLQCYQIPLDFSYLDEIKNSYKSSKDVELVKLRHKESWRKLLLVDEKHIKEVITEAHGTEGVGVDISMDFMELPKSVNGYDYVLVVVDRFSKYTTIIPTTKEITALGTAKLIHQQVFSLFGLPLSIVSDRDTRFTSEVWLELFKKLSLEFKDKWDEEIKNIQFAINSTYNSTIKLSPFEVVLGYIPVSPINMFRNNNTSNREWIREMVKDSLLDKQLDMLEADGTIKNKPTYQIGDWMFVKDEFINLEVDWNTNTGSINNKNRGPFKITKIFNNVQFKLNKDNESLVKGIQPDIIDNEEEFEIEQIIGDRMFRKKKQYQIKWLGYPLDKATWQYSKNMDHAKDLIKEYENNKKQQIQSKKKKSTNHPDWSLFGSPISVSAYIQGQSAYATESTRDSQHCHQAIPRVAVVYD
ncbi:hypothetical protein PPL_10579 [Heterostelium album PN500]|uniref:Uncharacterized protein n=1 Tax=Heterostelium pallidum (strain ATCC 26659 / Pp 5 / PN500) TaxID=670386 RepID=D3BRG8_HETP5|nr:hypothetical protein PPL_10579 [Heterostelium album PN500]EFA76000.1 hypothetical protein PPL_10579 [Heterostelium album PN500]|eukprot:XP_020428134.1 hypothetical protein PPL_10579 [Heterostelium album PN500]